MCFWVYGIDMKVPNHVVIVYGATSLHQEAYKHNY